MSHHVPRVGGVNRLADETSPYLRQHADNPVDWYPWGDEAFAAARAADKPILLSVGYSSCHWCHVMAHESFEDPEIAALVNDLFVSVKVDREERPDVDALYMEVVQALNGNGGWPMTVFLTPGGQPFFGGTYFPKTRRGGMISFPELCQRIDEVWRTQRADVTSQADQLTAALGRSSRLDPGEADAIPGVEALDGVYGQLRSQHDDRRGGFGTAPKFPQTMALEIVLRQQARDPSPVTQAMIETSLDAMASGGIYDHLGGGFARYSVDAVWLVPHFEKMLYDQALLARAYLHAWQVTGHERYRQVLDETIGYVLRDLRHPAGGFYSAEDADSEGIEGRFYVWSPDEIRAVLDRGSSEHDTPGDGTSTAASGPAPVSPGTRAASSGASEVEPGTEPPFGAAGDISRTSDQLPATTPGDTQAEPGDESLVAATSDISAPSDDRPATMAGSAESGASDGQGQGTSLADEVMAWYGIDPSKDEGNFEEGALHGLGTSILHRMHARGSLARPPSIEEARRRLFDARAQRVRPGLDDKVLTEWNGLMLATLAEAAAATGRDDWRAAAVATGEFLVRELRRSDGRWLRSWQSDGGARHLAYAADHGALIEAFVRLAEATGEARWLAEARTTADALVELFWDADRGGVFTTGIDAEQLVARPKDLMDNATPGGNSLAAVGLLRLAALTGDDGYRDRADDILRLCGPLAAEHPLAFGHLLYAVDLAARGIDEVVVAGDRPDLVATVQTRFTPNAVLAWGERYDSPLWQDRDDNRAYVCRNYTCQLPTTTPETLVAQLTP